MPVRNEFVRKNYRSPAAIRSAAPEFTNPTNFGPFQNWIKSNRGGGGAGIDVAGLIAGMQLGSNPQAQQANSFLKLASYGGSAEPMTNTAQPGAGEEDSILGRIFSTLDAPQNAVMNVGSNLMQAFNEMAYEGDAGAALKNIGEAGGAVASLGYQVSPLNALPTEIPFTDIPTGLGALDKLAAKGNPARSVSEELRRINYFKEHPWQREILGFAGDVATDPLTYIPFAGPFKALKTAVAGKVARKMKIKTGDELAEIERRANLEQPEDILENRAAGIDPNIKSRSTPDGADIAGNLSEVRIINKKPLTDLFEEGAIKTSGADSLRYLEPNAAAGIGEDIATKFREESRLVNEKKFTDLGSPNTDDLANAANKARQLRDQFTSVRAGLVGTPEAHVPETFTQSNMFQQFLDESLKATKTKKGNPSWAKAFDRALRQYKAGEDVLRRDAENLPIGHPNRFDFTFNGEKLSFSDVLSHFPKPKGKKDVESLKSLVGEFQTGYLGKNAHPVLVKAFREAQVSSIMRRPGFFQKFATASNKQIERATKKQGGPLTQEQYKAAVSRGAGDAVRNTAMQSPRFHPQIANELSRIVQKHITEIPATKIERLYQRQAEATLRGKNSTQAFDAETLAQEAVTGPLKTLKTRLGAPAGVATTITERLGSWLGERIVTWGDTAGLFPNFKRNIAHGSLSANARSRRARNILRKYDQDTINRAFNMHRFPDYAANNTVDDVTRKAYTEIGEWVDHVYGKSTLGKLQKAGFMQKSGLLMKDANKELDRLWGKEAAKQFKFRSDQFTDANGVHWDFRPPEEGGEGWWNSWKAWDTSTMPKHKVSNPVHMLHDIDLAIERKARLTSSLLDAGGRFGRKTPSDEFTFQVRDQSGALHPALENKYFPEDVARGLENLIKHYDKGSWAPTSEFGKFWAKALRVWKTSVTIYLPSHHFRNLVGDSWLMWMAGHNNPLDFYRGLRTVNAFKHRYKNVQRTGTWDNLQDEFIDPDVINTKSSSTIFRKGNKNFKADELYQAAYKRGILLEIDDLEDIGVEGVAPFFRERTGLGHRIHRKVQGVSEYREHYIRLTHFIAAVRKGYKPGMKNDSLQKLYDDAADEVMKWHPDGTDMTRWEQQYMKSLFPFYSWQRKSVPLIVEGFLTRPAKIVALPRAQMALSSALGLQEDNPSLDLMDPFPDTRRYPEWIRATGLAPFGMYGEPGAAGWLANLGESGYLTGTQDKTGSTTWNPGVPIHDLVADFGGTGSWNQPLYGVGQMTNPLAKIFFETAQGRTMTGTDIEEAPGDYAIQQIPGVSVAARLLPVLTQRGREDIAAGSKKPYSLEDILNALTGLQITGTGQYIKKSEFEAKERGGG